MNILIRPEGMGSKSRRALLYWRTLGRRCQREPTSQDYGLKYKIGEEIIAGDKSLLRKVKFSFW